jgi:type VI secretion system secreted protein VgrG
LGDYTQDNRLIQVFTTLGKDELLLQGFHGQEGVSQLFHFDLRMHSEKSGITLAELIGQPATVAVVLPDGEVRHINGLISHFAQGGSSPLEEGENPTVFAHYHATLVPWLWLLTRRSNCRIFQNLSVPDILEKIFKEYGSVEFSNRLQGSYGQREYCVQYRETDFNFVSRLMEEEGIFYFFEHEEAKHTLVLADSPNAFKPSPLHPSVSYRSVTGDEREEDILTEFTYGHELRPGKYTVADFNFEQPKLDLTATLVGTQPQKYEIYDYPGEYATKDAGEALVGRRLEAEQLPREVITGAGTCRGFVPGFRFKLREHYRNSFEREYVLTSVYHSADQGVNYRSSDEGAAADLIYSNSFQCLPHPTPFRPPRTTPVPLVHGSQTAIVTGKAGEEIWVDKYGRVKVQFHWDRDGQYDENSSCWVRVSQNWAGKKWGAMFLPRVGQEVIVDFLEGDPDQPIITGRVYNGENMPHYALPGEMTKSYIKSYSSKGGGGFNELRFEDKKGSEQVFLHAERQQDNRTKADSLEWVGHDRHLIVKHDQFEKVEGDKHLQIVGDQNEKVDGTVSLKVGMDLQQKVGMNAALDAGMEIHHKAGMNVMVESGMSMTVKSGMTLVLESGVDLTLKVGGNFISLNPAGVFIQGTMVMINSGGAAGAAGSGAGCSPEAPKDPLVADTGEPGEKSEMPRPKQPGKPTTYSPAALVMMKAAQNGAPFCDI